jgi:hypothetical protein
VTISVTNRGASAVGTSGKTATWAQSFTINAGDELLLVMAFGGPSSLGPGTVTVTDNKGGTWVVDYKGLTGAMASNNGTLVFARATTNPTSSPFTITMSWTNNCQLNTGLLQVSGLATSPVDQKSTATGGSHTAPTVSVTDPAAGDLALFAGVDFNNATWTAPSGWTLGPNANGDGTADGFATAYLIGAPAETVTANPTLTSDTNVLSLVTYLPPGGTTDNLAAVLPSAEAMAAALSQSHTLAAAEGSSPGLAAALSDKHNLAAAETSAAAIKAATADAHALSAAVTSGDTLHAGLSLTKRPTSGIGSAEALAARQSEGHVLAATMGTADALHADLTDSQPGATDNLAAIILSAELLKAGISEGHSLAAVEASAPSIRAAASISHSPAAAIADTSSIKASTSASHLIITGPIAASPSVKASISSVHTLAAAEASTPAIRAGISDRHPLAAIAADSPGLAASLTDLSYRLFVPGTITVLVTTPNSASLAASSPNSLALAASQQNTVSLAITPD